MISEYKFLNDKAKEVPCRVWDVLTSIVYQDVETYESLEPLGASFDLKDGKNKELLLEIVTNIDEFVKETKECFSVSKHYDCDAALLIHWLENDCEDPDFKVSGDYIM